MLLVDDARPSSSKIKEGWGEEARRLVDYYKYRRVGHHHRLQPSTSVRDAESTLNGGEKHADGLFYVQHETPKK